VKAPLSRQQQRGIRAQHFLQRLSGPYAHVCVAPQANDNPYTALLTTLEAYSASYTALYAPTALHASTYRMI
jgi:hypothetical protein